MSDLLQENLKSHDGGKTDGLTEGRPPDPPAGGRGVGVVVCSYAAATVGKASQFPEISLPRRQPFSKEGKPAVMFTPAEIGACAKQLEFALIAKFSNGRPHVMVVEREFRNSWKLEGQLTVSDLDGRHIMVILNSEKDIISALTQAPRRVGTSLFRLFRWSPEFHLRKESTRITIWIRFPRLRPDLFNEGVLKCLCQPFGKFLDSDGHTKQRTRCSYARCCVEIDITKTLPHEIWIDMGDGNGWWQEIVYEGNLKYCSKCKIHGHILSECRKVRMKPAERKEDNPERDQEVQKVKGAGSVQVPLTQQNNNQEWIQVQNRKARYAENEPKKQQQSGQVEKETGQEAYPILVEEGEVEENTESEAGNEGNQVQQTIILKKSNSEAHLDQLVREEAPKSVEYLTRSQSMDDIQKNCSERRLEYIQEEFQHFHLIHKHLLKTKIETLARLQKLEERKKQNHSYQEESQKESWESGREENEMVVPETQIGSSQTGDKGEPKQNKKLSNQSASKPKTRAAKKKSSPKKK